MKIDDVLSLENGKKYLLLLDSKINEKNYFLAVLVDDNEEPLKEYEVLEQIIDNGEEYVEIIKDPIILNTLLQDFTAQQEDMLN